MSRYRKTLDKIKVNDDLINKTYSRIEHEKINKKHQPKLYYAVALCACFIMMVMIIPKNFAVKAETYISLDINPSIQLTVNKDGYVTGINAYNDEGIKISEDIEYEGHNYLDVCKEIISVKFDEYIKNDSFLLISISNQSDDTDIYIKELQSMIDDYYINAKVQSCDSHIIEEANNAEMSIGKYSQYLVLKEYDKTTTVDRCREMSITEIHSEIESHHSQESHNSSNHHGNHHD
ncbi:MAG: hypothetical protein PUC68_08195 [Firmicutes bacterium]|nr:hypothetical protein [Bacillota bacterium]MDY3092603.1 hypothetical protein [Erysipelotrichaceae bacterium]